MKTNANETDAAPSMTIDELFDATIARVESLSIRDWMRSEHNEPIIRDSMAHAKDKNPDRWAAYLVCLAIGA